MTTAGAVLTSGLVFGIYSPCLQLVVASSNEKSDLLKELVTKYVPPRVERRCFEVTITEIASGTAERALAKDWKDTPGPRPHVWSPAAKTWLLLLEEDRRLKDLPPIVPAVAESIIQSPLVIAMPQPMADAIRSASGKIGWRDIVTLARDPAGWARFGKPWGSFKFAQTTPFISTSGLHAMLSINNAAQVEADPTGFVKALNASVLHYSDSVRTFLRSLYAADGRHEALSYVSAIAVEEKQVFDYNRGNPDSDVCDPKACGRIPNDKLVALYPKEGTLYADHPYAILDWPAQEDADLFKQAARDFQSFLEGTDQQKRFTEQGFRDHRTQAGPGLEPPYFDPAEPTALYASPVAATVQQLRTRWKNEIRKPANAIVLLDLDPSLARADRDSRATRFEEVKGAIVGTLDELGPEDLLGLRTFPTSTGLAYREVFTPRRLGPPPSQFAESVNALQTESGTRSLYAAIGAAFEAVRASYSAERVNAVVVVTNGGNETNDRLDALRAVLQQRGDRRILMFVVALPSAPTEELNAIVGDVGGAYYEARDTSNIPESIRRALLNL